MAVITDEGGSALLDEALAQILDEAGLGSFTVGTLTALTTAGGSGGTLTAADTRTGGPA